VTYLVKLYSAFSGITTANLVSGLSRDVIVSMVRAQPGSAQNTTAG